MAADTWGACCKDLEVTLSFASPIHVNIRIQTLIECTARRDGLFEHCNDLHRMVFLDDQ